MNQLGLFNDGYRPPTRRARNTDPETSHEAATNAEVTGLITRQARECLKYLIKFPGRTSAELGVLAKDGAGGLPPLGDRARHIFGRRLPELAKLEVGLAERGERRKCTAHGTNAVTWWPTELALT